MKKRILAVAAAMAVAVVMMFGGTASAFADEAKTANVEVTMQKDYSFVLCHKNVKASSDLSDKYGLKDNCSGVSVLDVMLAMHEEYYGDKFTKDSMEDYFIVKEGSYGGYSVYKIFGTGDDASVLSCGYYVNDAAAMSTDDEVADGAKFDMFIYQDTTNYSDKYTTFGSSSYKGKTEQDITVKLNAEQYGSDWRPYNVPLAGADIYVVENGKISEEPIARTDDNGEAVVSFKTAGVYNLTAKYKEMPIVMPWCTVTVTGDEDPVIDPSDDLSEDPSQDPTSDQTEHKGTEASTDKKSDTAKTGDDSNIMIFVLIAAAAAVCGGVTVFARRKAH